MNKAVIMEVTSRHWIVMTSCGQFKKVTIHNNRQRIGDEIQLPRTSYMQRRSVLSAAIACILLFFIVVSFLPGGIFSQNQVVAAYVTIDVNPSIELGIDRKGWIIEVTAINQDGEQLLESVGKLKGLQASEAAKKIFQSTMITDLLHPYMEHGGGNIVISSTIVADDLGQFDEFTITHNMTTEIESLFSGEAAAMSGNVAVTNLYTPRELREEAKKHGVSVGKVAMKLLSVEVGKQLEWADLQHTNIGQIAAELGGWDQLIAIEEDATKDKFRELYNLQMQTVQAQSDVQTSNSEEKNIETEEQPRATEPNTSNEWPRHTPSFASHSKHNGFQTDPVFTTVQQQTEDDRGNYRSKEVSDRKEKRKGRGRSESVRERSNKGHDFEHTRKENNRPKLGNVSERNDQGNGWSRAERKGR